MKILISSYSYAPNVGGLEEAGGLLVDAWENLGHQVRVVTQTPGDSTSGESSGIIRVPSCWTVYRQVRWCDVYIQNNISLKTFWPALFCRRPIVLIHQTWISRVDGRIAWQDRLKLRAVRSAVKNIAVSAALADSIPARCEVVPNPYRHEIFRVFSPNRRDRALIFVGRLVSDKGCSLLLKALVELGKLGMFPTLTIVGTGPEESNLRGQVEKEGLRAKVDFVGRKSGGELANILNCHRVLVVPSLWQEPFGIVALEGIACGCVVVGSSGGGLSGAIGRCGITFENGDVKGLVAALMKVLEDSEYCASFGEQRAEHLRHHRADVVGRRYIDIFNSVIPNG